eukprot:1156510-Pelagomonas_calceolata.AAC.7
MVTSLWLASSKLQHKACMRFADGVMLMVLVIGARNGLMVMALMAIVMGARGGHGHKCKGYTP